MSKSTDEAWVFLKDFAEKDQQWKSILVPSHECMRGVHLIDSFYFHIDDSQPEGGPFLYPSEQANVLSYNNATTLNTNPTGETIQIYRGQIQITCEPFALLSSESYLSVCVSPCECVCLSLLVCMANSQYVQVFFLVCMSVIVCVYVW